MATRKSAAKKAVVKKAVKAIAKTAAKAVAKTAVKAKKTTAKKPGAKPTAKTVAQPAAAKKAPVKAAVKRAAAPKAIATKPEPPKKSAAVKKPRGAADLDFSAFPPEALYHEKRWLCLACVLDVFTRQLGMAPVTAQSQIRHYSPTADEITSTSPARPYLGAEAEKEPCQWCAAPPKWHVALDIHRIESGKATDAARRGLVKALGEGDAFHVVEEKATQRDAFYDWLHHTSDNLNLDDPQWLMEATQHYLSRKDPKTDWAGMFTGLQAVRRSRRVEEGWEIDGGRLFLSPRLFDEVLLVQYLLSRGHRSGGVTFEGRLTLGELIRRLRGAGYLRAAGVQSGDAGDAFEQLIEILGGGETGMKFYYVVDRRALLTKLQELRTARVPKAKPASV